MHTLIRDDQSGVSPRSEGKRAGAIAWPRRRSSAFTLIELICVLVILAVISALVAPRVLNTKSRTAELESQAVQRILGVAGQRSALWSLPVAVDYADGRMTLWAQRADGAAAVDAVGAATARWAPDPLTDTVTLANTQIKQATVNGIVLPKSKWRVEFAPGQPRPVLAITLEMAGGDASGAGWEVKLDPEAVGVSRVATGAGAAATSNVARSIDLDDAGKGTAAW